MSSKTFLEQYKAARRAATPLMAINTADPAATIHKIVSSTPSSNGTSVAFVQWNVIDGLSALNDAGAELVGEICGSNVPAEVTADPIDMLKSMYTNLPEYGVLFIHNAQLFLSSNFDRQIAFIQAVWNLRDELESRTATVVMLGPNFTMPPELAQDVLVLDEPLPDSAQLTDSIQKLAKANGIRVDEEQVARGTDALRGLASFPAKQATAMCLSKGGLDTDALWDRKKHLIDTTPGLSIYRPKPEDPQSFDDLGGLWQLKAFLKQILNGRRPPKLIVFIDEIEKALAGATGVGDSSGVSQGQLEFLLTEMQNQRYRGLSLLGHPGGGKSAIAKTTGIEAGVPTITLDLNGLKGSLVGESDQKLRHAMKVIYTVGDGQALFIATCNRYNTLPPELKRRFNQGTFFIDLPSPDEQAAIWPIFEKRYEIDAKEKDSFKHLDWTGAEIENVCEKAYDFRISLKEAAKYVVPIAISAKEEIADLRRQASGKFLSASKPGVYVNAEMAVKPTTDRRLNLSEN